jgi:hypothetical protein
MVLLPEEQNAGPAETPEKTPVGDAPVRSEQDVVRAETKQALTERKDDAEDNDDEWNEDVIIEVVNPADTLRSLIAASPRRQDESDSAIDRYGQFLADGIVQHLNVSVLEFCKAYCIGLGTLEEIYHVSFFPVPPDFALPAAPFDEKIAEKDRERTENIRRWEEAGKPPFAVENPDGHAAALEALRLKRATALGDPALPLPVINAEKREAYAEILGLPPTATWFEITRHEQTLEREQPAS